MKAKTLLHHIILNVLLIGLLIGLIFTPLSNLMVFINLTLIVSNGFMVKKFYNNLIKIIGDK